MYKGYYCRARGLLKSFLLRPSCLRSVKRLMNECGVSLLLRIEVVPLKDWAIYRALHRGNKGLRFDIFFPFRLIKILYSFPFMDYHPFARLKERGEYLDYFFDTRFILGIFAHKSSNGLDSC